jgi:hypothetical protein
MKKAAPEGAANVRKQHADDSAVLVLRSRPTGSSLIAGANSWGN